MVGCEEPDFARIEAALGPMSRATFRAGDHGAGQAAKICNNMIVGITMLGTCEAIGLPEKLAQDGAAKVGASTPLGAQTEALFQMFNGLGYSGRDFSAILQMLRGQLDGLPRA
jgi:3-hydroxyisobutyrate dehydrogenase